MTTIQLSDLTRQANELAAEEILVATNEGTFGASDCQRACGTGDPAFGNYRIYQTVGGGKPFVVGCDPDMAPGYRRDFRETLTDKQAQLADLRREIKAAK